MSVITRGVKNAFRNKLRTGAVVLILAIGIGLALSLLVAHQAVENRIAELKTNMGTNLTVNPAGSRGFEGGGEPLTEDDVKKIESLSHIADVNASLDLRMQKEAGDGKEMKAVMDGPGGSFNVGSTNLTSSIDPGTLGARFNSSGAAAKDISLPIRMTGLSGTKDATGGNFKITSGRMLKKGDTYSAIVGKQLAAKNNLKVGSTFEAFEKKFKVVGIFDKDNEFENAQVYIPLDIAQELGEQENEVGTITVKVDSIDNVKSVAKAIENKLGSDKVDVTSSEESIDAAIEGLEGVKKVSMVGFIASLVAAGVIIFLIMTVIVRERRKEIGVLKAIGGGNGSIVAQFIVEAMVLVMLGAAVGVLGAVAGSNGIANALVSTSSSGTGQTEGPAVGPSGVRMGGLGMKLGANPVDNTKEIVGTVTANVGIGTLLYGLLAAFAIALVGSALPAWFIAHVRPAEVMRGE